MALDSVHPKYTEMLPDWEKMRDVYKGERHVKEQGTKYLPATQSMILDGFGSPTLASRVNVGAKAYDAYRTRAVLPDYLQDAVEVFMGLLHSQPPKIELPEALEPMREKATQLGESLEQLLRRVNEEQLVPGRLGLLLDLPKNPDPTGPVPYIAMYVAEAITNWDDGEIEDDKAKLNMVVLDESGYKRVGFEWDFVSQYRVLELTPVAREDGAPSKWGPYRVGVFQTGAGGAPDYVESQMINPALRGNILDEIPFVFINTKDIVAAPDKPTLLGLANACLTIYRGEADYRQNLHMQGQDTLVVKGELKRSGDPNQLAAAGDDSPLRLGTGAMIHLEGGSDNGAEFIGVSANGLSEQRTALENDHKRTEAKSTALSASSGDNVESGEALKTRVGARTASLNSIAITGAGALEWQLKVAAKWMGADPEKVKVTPNMEFADYQMTGDMLNKLIAAKRSGAPLSNESIHALMAEGGITKMDYLAEKALVDQERQEEVPPGTDAGGDEEDDLPPGGGA